MGKRDVGSPWEVDQYPSDQICLEGRNNGRGMALQVTLNCFAKWRGELGRIMAYSGQGRRAIG